MADTHSRIADLQGHVKRLEQALKACTKKALDPDALIAPPRLTLRGIFMGFDEETQTLEVRMPGEPDDYYYPLSHYDGEWLPIPGQQVIITRSSRGAPLWGRRSRAGKAASNTWPRIIGFSRYGASIPPAPVLSYKVEEYDCSTRALRVRAASGEELQLTLPETFDDLYDPDIRFGEVLHFRVIDVFPGRYYIPIEIPTEPDNAERYAEILSLTDD